MSWVEWSWVELSWVELSWVEGSWVEGRGVEGSWDRIIFMIYCNSNAMLIDIHIIHIQIICNIFTFKLLTIDSKYIDEYKCYFVNNGVKERVNPQLLFSTPSPLLLIIHPRCLQTDQSRCKDITWPMNTNVVNEYLSILSFLLF